jgi:pimeloyl-ACP methyl ester carboxylesterase
MRVHRRNTLLLGILMLVSILAKANPLATGWETVAGINLFYREGGPREAPTIVFLHGNPASSIQYVRVMEFLAKRYHVLAMDYPSFGFSAAPDRADYRYTFDNLAGTVREFLRARNVTRHVLFMQDYGVPIGFRLIAQAPDAVSAIVVQNGVIHLDGFPTAQDENGELRRHWRARNPLIDARRRTFTMEMKFPERKGWEWPQRIPPEFVVANMIAAQRPGVIAARNDLWFDYGSNLDHYSEWQALLRRMQPPLLVLWGGRDSFFTTPGAFAYLRDVPRAEVHILDADHYATMEVPDEIADITGQFLDRTVGSRNPLGPLERSNRTNRESH